VHYGVHACACEKEKERERGVVFVFVHFCGKSHIYLMERITYGSVMSCVLFCGKSPIV